MKKDVANVTEKGLREIIAADTVISDIDGEQGRLWYVGYDIADLAEHATFEEVVYLLHNRTLPNQDQLDDLDEFLTENRELSPFLTELMSTLRSRPRPCRCCARRSPPRLPTTPTDGTTHPRPSTARRCA